ncbi:hypothetical protein ASPTUDRAFT_124398 [Aspergillus tubingensis CBS 134.48]|uniref:ARCA protein n=1 Tax=Aspergillus tubingensis (strain CBS 134.48) TaxID=767770 RepID=A0A1L9MZP9_ASPTC|nr:hypothetical protein ASPTUDRAFT_124398 [Aspergillus tubingensis CBS 134.48]
MTPRVKQDHTRPEASTTPTTDSRTIEGGEKPTAHVSLSTGSCQQGGCRNNLQGAVPEASSPRQQDPKPPTAPVVADTSNLGVANEPDKALPDSAGEFARGRYPLGPLHGLPDTNSITAYLSWEEACLIRHFAENLAQWFETSDRDRHFSIVVPERAMFCPVLRYAVFTASAGHLTRLASCRRGKEVNLANGVSLRLNPEAAIRYHDICISYLLEISNDPREEYNEDVLTAATILRFYEQIEAPSLGHSDTYLNAIKFIVNTQGKESFYAYQNIQGPSPNPHVHSTPSLSLHHSACLSALRQEFWSAFLHQRPFPFPVSSTNNYSLCDIATDFIWANRIFVWVADLLIFCFGNDKLGMEERARRWRKLKAVEEQWQQSSPPAFKPIYYRAADPASGKYFPEIWHMNTCQVAGAQHVELGRILLAVSDPARTSRLGLGAWSRSQILASELRNITRRLCGLAISNRPCPAAWVTAMVGISVCGEYFTDTGEQDALVRLLQRLEYDHAWPTESTIQALRNAWEHAT